MFCSFDLCSNRRLYKKIPNDALMQIVNLFLKIREVYTTWPSVYTEMTEATEGLKQRRCILVECLKLILNYSLSEIRKIVPIYIGNEVHSSLGR